MNIAPVYLSNIDWGLLREQMSWLQDQCCDESEGLLALLESLQDQAADSLGQITVFGYRHD